jgi:hypothetical protein
MTQGTTPTFTLTLPNTVDLTQAAAMVFTMSQGSAVVEKEENDLSITEHAVEVYLTQADTLKFQIYSEAKIQLNWIYSDGSRACTKVKTISVEENLHDEVMV